MAAQADAEAAEAARVQASHGITLPRLSVMLPLRIHLLKLGSSFAASVLGVGRRREMRKRLVVTRGLKWPLKVRLRHAALLSLLVYLLVVPRGLETLRAGSKRMLCGAAVRRRAQHALQSLVVWLRVVERQRGYGRHRRRRGALRGHHTCHPAQHMNRSRAVRGGRET